jgi:hypothetical protein
VSKRRNGHPKRRRADRIPEPPPLVLYAFCFLVVVLGLWRFDTVTRDAREADRARIAANEKLSRQNQRVTRQLQRITQQQCEAARRQRDALEEQFSNTKIYLVSAAGREPTALNDFIRRSTVPQLRKRLEAEQVPRSCAIRPFAPYGASP